MKSTHYFTLIFVVLAIAIAFIILRYKPQNDIAIGNLDVAAWKDDKNGCKGNRMAQKENIETVFRELEQKREAEIMQLLGNPDYQDLFERGQKYYVYRMESNKACGTEREDYLRLRIRFNALGKVNEVNFSRQ
jgi:hypothetical protein